MDVYTTSPLNNLVKLYFVLCRCHGSFFCKVTLLRNNHARVCLKIVMGVSFIQVYGNYQLSDAFVGIQKNKLPNIKNFYNKDLGINFHKKIGKKGELNSYNYYIDESFNGYGQIFNYTGSVASL